MLDKEIKSEFESNLDENLRYGKGDLSSSPIDFDYKDEYGNPIISFSSAKEVYEEARRRKIDHLEKFITFQQQTADSEHGTKQQYIENPKRAEIAYYRIKSDIKKLEFDIAYVGHNEAKFRKRGTQNIRFGKGYLKSADIETAIEYLDSDDLEK